MSEQECCQKAVYNPPDAGGQVFCCNCKKIACTRQKWRQPIQRCLERHEEEHFEHVEDCTRCGVYLAPGKRTWPRYRAECEAAKVHVKCLRDRRDECGADPSCLKQVDDTISQQIAYGNAHGVRCQGLP
jgi:hypothetical protein